MRAQDRRQLENKLIYVITETWERQQSGEGDEEKQTERQTEWEINKVVTLAGNGLLVSFEAFSPLEIHIWTRAMFSL